MVRRDRKRRLRVVTNMRYSQRECGKLFHFDDDGKFIGKTLPKGIDGYMHVDENFRHKGMTITDFNNCRITFTVIRQPVILPFSSYHESPG